MFNEIERAVFEWPKEEGMNVPVRVIAERQVLERMMTDRTLSQAKNVAMLPGIIEASYVMPDGHEGYGFPIGGVGAFDVETGVVSPGGIGYDINCLGSDTQVLTEFGYRKRIKDFESDFGKVEAAGEYQLSLQRQHTSLVSLDENTLKAKQLLAFMKKKADKRMLRITTSTGKQIVCSEDHPLKVQETFKPAGQVHTGDTLSVQYFEGVGHEKVQNEVRTALLARILGYFMGDGTLCHCGKKLRASAYGQKEDMEKLQEDIKRLGFNAGILERTRSNTIQTRYGKKTITGTATEVYVQQKAFCELLQQAGMPIGKKTYTEYSVPAWINASPAWIQRLFLAGLFGAELSAPRTHTKTGFDVPVLCMNKNEIHKDNGRHFLIQIMNLLERFGVQTTKIAERFEDPNKQGDVVRLRLEISAEEDNLLRLWTKIGFEYQGQKRQLAEIACKYILLKHAIHDKRSRTDCAVKEYKKKGLTLKEAQKLLADGDVNERFIEGCYYENAGQRIPLDFVSFKDFKTQGNAELLRYGALQDQVSEITEEKYEGEVYDFTVAETHNFIANGIVVSNCGVRLVRTNFMAEEVKPKLKELTDTLYNNVPCGVGGKGSLRLSHGQLEDVVTKGVDWAIEKGYGVKNDAEHCEENGCLDGADYSKVSDMARKRGSPQVGTLGSGNHFLEVQRVEKVYDENIAKAFGISGGQATLMIHSGSRGFGHQVCDDYIRIMLRAAEKYKINLPDRELCCAPVNSQEAEDYLGAMACAVNYAFCNRQLMTHWVRQTMEQVFKKSSDEMGLDLVYDVCHNIGKFEEHEVGGEKRKVFVHRKGATRAFWAGRREIPKTYCQTGQPVIIPGSMNTSSYLLCGLPGAAKTFGSSCHGAGRVMSRHEALRRFDGRKIEEEMRSKGQAVRAPNPQSLAEEAGGAYKNVDDVVASVEAAGLCKIVAKMVPLGVIKG
ncbi:RtcB family protein [Candidatus Micrarchaeota archaeon]|nr:RtcB family protein [Candidatus Micrarchaeota archaeon]